MIWIDACQKVTIETLEAVRLFMFTKSTAFVIDADEAMNRITQFMSIYPNLPSKDEAEANKTDYDYSKRYLEKLIQVPFKIPALGRVESEMYITLLMIGSQVRDDDDKYKALLVTSLEKMKKPWENTGLSIDDLKKTLGDQYDTVSAEIDVATQISEILANNTQGNPRNIKRFLTCSFYASKWLPHAVSATRFQLPILAKLMLAEFLFSTEYASIALSLNDDDGKC
jgi:predicted KAP-like P-loop ATPase